MAEQGGRKTNIHFDIHLDNNNVPEKLTWDATDAETRGEKECRAVLLALWDHTQKNGLSIDLWTKEMTVQEMNLFFYQTFMTMSDTFLRSTQNKEVAGDIQTFANDFLEKIKRLEKNEAIKS